MNNSVQTKALAVVGLLASFYPLLTMSRMAFDPEYNIGLDCGLLAAWGSLISSACIVLGLISAAIDLFTRPQG